MLLLMSAVRAPSRLPLNQERGQYSYAISQCDVPIERRRALQSYRDKRRLWLAWISTDEHHAIWTVLSSMVWTDVAFKTLTNFAVGDDQNALNNSLLIEALLDGHVATQVLAIRRLMDDSNSDVISLRRLVKTCGATSPYSLAKTMFVMMACPTTTRPFGTRTL
jgi:hypothetical protein